MEKHDNVNFKVVDAAQLENVEGLIGRFLAPGAYQVQKSDDGDVNRGFLSRAFYQHTIVHILIIVYIICYHLILN